MSDGLCKGEWCHENRQTSVPRRVLWSPDWAHRPPTITEWLCHHVTSFPHNTTYMLSGAGMGSWGSHWRKEPSLGWSPVYPDFQRENHERMVVMYWDNPSRAGHRPSYLWFPWGGHRMPDFPPVPQINRTIKGRLNDELTWWSVQVHSRDTGHYKGFSNSARKQHNKNQ